MDLVILCDFDGTIITIDTLRFLLEKFTKDNWKTFISQYEQGKITLKECLDILWSKLRLPKNVMLDELERAASVRPNFKNFLIFCRNHDIPFIISSAGLDFIVHHFLEIIGYRDQIKIVTLKTIFHDKKVNIMFPKLLNDRSLDFKEDLVKNYQRNGFQVFFIGDGISDYNASLNADFSFTIKDSELDIFCKKRGIPHQAIMDFQDVINVLKNVISSGLK